MDPDACLKQLEEALQDITKTTPDERLDLCRNLQDWMDKGGYEPTWGNCRRATLYFRAFTDAGGPRR